MGTGSPSVMPTPLSADDVLRRREPLRDINKEIAENVGLLERMAVWIAEHVGSMGFFVVIFAWTTIWLGWNLLAPPALQFDPPVAFAFWLFLSNVLQMLLMPLIMVGQNIQARLAETRTENDLQVNITAEREIETILRHLDYQNRILIAMLERLGINLDEVLREKA
jgi:uncharacterized membrane protein